MSNSSFFMIDMACSIKQSSSDWESGARLLGLFRAVCCDLALLLLTVGAADSDCESESKTVIDSEDGDDADDGEDDIS